MSDKNQIEASFPLLKNISLSLTSPSDGRYNCLAWAAGDDKTWWQPDPMSMYYWPDEAPRQNTLDSWVKAFQSLCFDPCPDADVQAGVEKVSIYAAYAAKSVPTHAARQLPSGIWTSKLGRREDVTHRLEDLEESQYESVALILSRPKAADLSS